MTAPSDSLPAGLHEKRKGTYILLLHLASDAQIAVGQRGVYAFGAGTYAYVGSAFGSGGLAGRLRHHLSPVTTCHWHIDYLRQAAAVMEVWFGASPTVYEHRWASVLQGLPGAFTPVPRFGASDCQCATHLIGFADAPTFETFALAAETPELERCLIAS